MKKIIFLISLLLPGLLSAQTTIFGNLQDHVDEIIDGMPGSSGNQFSNLLPSQEADWRVLFQLIVEENFSDAAAAASPLQYNFLRFIDNSQAQNEEFYILEKMASGSNYWGTYIFKPDACRRLVVQSPHSKYDTNTGKQGVFVFRNLNTYALFLNGTHRCNHNGPSGCSGSTSACGSSAPYRRSDVAHNTLSGFHIATEVLFDLANDLYFVQLHGFAKQSTDPYVIMSNGSRDTPGFDLAAEIRNGLLNADPSLTFKIGHIDLSWDRLLAFSNTEGRYINASGNPCTENAPSGNGRFVHIEQELSKLRADEGKWAKMLAALEEAVTCNSASGIEPENLKESWYRLSNDNIQFDLPEAKNYELTYYNWLGQLISTRKITAHEIVPLERIRSGFFVVRSNEGFVLSIKFHTLNHF